MRQIDADALVYELTEMVRHSTGEYKHGIDAARLVSMEAPTIGGWISVKDRLPEDDRTVLAVKQLKDGRRDMCLARCIPNYEFYDVETGSIIKKPYWVCGGNNNIIYWMPLPEPPKEEL